jgi:hypothetical protein
MNEQVFSGSKAVELNCQDAASRTDLEKVVQFHRLAPVKSNKVEFSPAGVGTGSTIFAPAEMRHNFAIWASRKNPASGRQQHLYYCVRCKEVFSVDYRSGSVTPLDPHGDPIQGTEAAKRLATFDQGPCPVFSRLISKPRLRPKVIPIASVQGRFAALILKGRRAWQGVIGQWRRFSAESGFQNQRNQWK